ncbi:hypothetical protein HY546_01160 [archaeon]|nr:hypothetical protein [archaeon]
MTAITFQVSGRQREMLNFLIGSGMVRTKTEALRFSLARTALEFGYMRPREFLEHLRGEAAKRKRAPQQITADIERAKNETVS